MPAERVLITGGSGFIGGACVKAFLDAGYEVSALVHKRVSASLEAWQAEGRVSLVRASIAKGDDLYDALARCGSRGFKAVVHCAGRATEVGRRSAFRDSHLTGMENLTACFERLPLERLVHISTTDVYGIKDFQDADESTSLHNNRNNPYPEFKIRAEMILRDRLPPERYVILRPAAVWGPGDRSILPKVLRYLENCFFLTHFGGWKGKNHWPAAYIGNVTKTACVAASVEEALGETYNIVDRERITVDTFYRELIGLFYPEKKNIRALCLPLAFGYFPALLSSILSNLFGLDRPLFEPSLYGLYSVAHNLDFCGRKYESLLERNGTSAVDREEAWQEFKTWVRGDQPPFFRADLPHLRIDP